MHGVGEEEIRLAVTKRIVEAPAEPGNVVEDGPAVSAGTFVCLSACRLGPLNADSGQPVKGPG
jgi:hypothetical protein